MNDFLKVLSQGNLVPRLQKRKPFLKPFPFQYVNWSQVERDHVCYLYRDYFQLSFQARARLDEKDKGWLLHLSLIIGIFLFLVISEWVFRLQVISQISCSPL